MLFHSLIQMFYFLARRFVAGQSAQEALKRAKELEKMGLLTTLDHLGEHVRDPQEAFQVSQEYASLLDAVHQDSAASTISVKPTHLGLDINETEVFKNLRTILQAAKKNGNFVRLDMEGSPYTEATLRVFGELHREFSDHVGIVIQAYLYRSAEDIEELIMKKARVRLCKGAYREPVSIAFSSRSDVNNHFDKLSEMLMKQGHYPAIATHDEKRIRNAISYARLYHRNFNDFEFQMLLGVKTRLALDLVKSGYRVRLYLPYGKDWFSYFYRRLRERKENFYFALSNIFKG